MNRIHGDSPRARMAERFLRFLDLCRKANGTMEYALVGPDPEAAWQLGELLDADPSPEERDDLEVVGWLPAWRRNHVDVILRARDMVGSEFGQPDGPARGATNSDAGPRTLH